MGGIFFTEHGKTPGDLYTKMLTVVIFQISLNNFRAKKLGSSDVKSDSGIYRKVEET